LRNPIALAYVLVTGGRLPTNLDALLRAIRVLVPDVTEADVGKVIAWALRQVPLREPRQARRPRPRLRLVQ
jgi:hypothetical protein